MVIGEIMATAFANVIVATRFVPDIVRRHRVIKQKAPPWIGFEKSQKTTVQFNHVDVLCTCARAVFQTTEVGPEKKPYTSSSHQKKFDVDFLLSMCGPTGQRHYMMWTSGGTLTADLTRDVKKARMRN